MARRETASIQFRLPDGTRITNRFQSSDTLGDARAYLLEVCSAHISQKTVIISSEIYWYITKVNDIFVFHKTICQN